MPLARGRSEGTNVPGGTGMLLAQGGNRRWDVIRSGMLERALVAVGAAALPLALAVGGAAPASADPDICVGGPWGYAYACIDTPGWADYWYDDGWYGGGPKGPPGWKPGHGPPGHGPHGR